MVESSQQEASTELPSFDAVWDRLKKIAGFKRQADLAEALKITGSSVSGAKQRGLFPLEWAYKLALTKQISLDYILKGEQESAAVTSGVGFPMQEAQPGDLDRLHAENAELRAEVKELRAENRELNAENRRLLKENGDLRVELAELKARTTPDAPDGASRRSA